MSTISSIEVKELARYGASVRIQELEKEISAIRAAFPDLKDSQPKRSHMSPAARKAASIRMKKYWAERRRAKASSTRRGAAR